MKTFAIGDIHGNYKALKQCLERANVDYEVDTVIQLGDIVDGHTDTFEVVEELLKIRNLVLLKGNHDVWFFDWLNTGFHVDHWLQGGFNTAKSYMKQLDKEHLITRKSQGYLIALIPEDVSASHWRFFANQRFYYVDNKNRCFVHAGFDRKNNISEIRSYNPEQLYWDRELMQQAMSCKQGKLKTKDKFEEIFIGHTTTQLWNTTLPITRGGVTNLDTGAGGSGKLTIMNVDTHEYWQSDDSKTLYPDYIGRGG